MSEFVKPKAVFVSDTEYIQNLVNAHLRKDLHGNEEICTYCQSTWENYESVDKDT